MRARTSAALLLFLLTLAPVFAEAPNRQTHERLHPVLWVQTSPEFQMACEQVFSGATAQLNAALDDPFWTATEVQTGAYSDLPPAAIFDLDETVLDNSPLQARLVKERTDYVHEMWLKWEQEGNADAIPGAVHFIKRLQARGVTPFFVSNRGAASKTATLENLRQLLGQPDLPAEQVMLKGEQPDWTSDKTSRRRVVAKKYRIIFQFGDVYEDFVELGHLSAAERKARAADYRENWGKCWFLLPNPAYGNWERALYDFDNQAQDRDILRRKIDALNTKE